MGIEIEFALDRSGGAVEAPQIPTGLAQDSGGEMALGIGEMVILRSVHVFDRLVSSLFKKFRTPHFREF